MGGLSELVEETVSTPDRACFEDETKIGLDVVSKNGWPNDVDDPEETRSEARDGPALAMDKAVSNRERAPLAELSCAANSTFDPNTERDDEGFFPEDELEYSRDS